MVKRSARECAREKEKYWEKILDYNDINIQQVCYDTIEPKIYENVIDPMGIEEKHNIKSMEIRTNMEKTLQFDGESA